MPWTPEKIARMLIDLGCLSVSPARPFTYASGLKGPLYCDNRKLLAHPQERRWVAQAFVEKIQAAKLEFDIIAGLATAGIPHAAWIADILQVPMAYVRGKPKEHGKQSQVEGACPPGGRALVIEDLVNQGKSLDEAVEGMKKAGLVPVACLCIVDYQMPQAKQVAAKHSLPLLSLTDFEAIVGAARAHGGLGPQDEGLLRSWHRDPQSWGN